MNILGIFAHSTFHPIKHHMDMIYQSMQFFPVFLDEVYRKEWNKALDIQHKMLQLQQEASVLKHQILLQVSTDFFKPTASRDIFELITEQSKIAKIVESIANLMLERKVHIPRKVALNYLGFINACLGATEKAKLAVDALENFLKATKDQSVRLPLYRILLELEECASEACKIHRELKMGLLTLEKNMMPMETNSLYKIFEYTEKIVDKAQLVGHRLQLLLTV